MRIDLSRRNIIEFDSAAFSTDDDREVLNSITRLDISYNSISSLYGLRCLSTLRSLDVSNNNVTSLRGLPPLLRQLNASFNALTDVEGLSPLLHLEVLVVSHNKITSLEGIPASVRIVDASSNRIASLRGLEECTLLEELQVRQNIIENVEGIAIIKSLHSLKAVTLAENPVTSSKRRAAAVYAILPPTLQFVDLPSKSWMKHTSAASSFSHTASLNTATVRDTINISCFSPDSTVRTSRDASTRGSSSRSAASSSNVSLHTKNEHKNRKQPFSEDNMTTLITGNDVKAAPPSFLLHREASSFSNTDQDSTSYDSRDVTHVQEPQQQQALSDVNILAPNVHAQQMTSSLLEHLQSELDECQRTCLFYKMENEELKLHIQQLQSKNEYQERMNTILLERNQRLQLLCTESSPLQQGQIISASTDMKDHVEGGGAVQSTPLLMEPLIGFCKKSSGNVRTEASGDDSQHCHVEELSGEVSSLEARAELRRGARSLAGLFMSLVPKPELRQLRCNSPSTADAAASNDNTNNTNSNSSHHHLISPQSEGGTNNINAKERGSLRETNAVDKGRKRSVSFGGFAYYSPPPW
ncbi:hypothetical protein MOQ_000532 [Trypanosoma cruzi marinkellei]|uniref:Leucine-rich repeat protein (LRRP) n=1 Tax=Trypanosoma cruzi marinkellei TaxID=85056 RepID=K2PE69_TRYCR|nr:hypothetical protein MOQ_000532 [Trypanosoma cruzi marinkellei]